MFPHQSIHHSASMWIAAALQLPYNLLQLLCFTSISHQMSSNMQGTTHAGRATAKPAVQRAMQTALLLINSSGVLIFHVPQVPQVLNCTCHAPCFGVYTRPGAASSAGGQQQGRQYHTTCSIALPIPGNWPHEARDDNLLERRSGTATGCKPAVDAHVACDNKRDNSGGGSSSSICHNRSSASPSDSNRFAVSREPLSPTPLPKPRGGQQLIVQTG